MISDDKDGEWTDETYAPTPPPAPTADAAADAEYEEADEDEEEGGTTVELDPTGGALTLVPRLGGRRGTRVKKSLTECAGLAASVDDETVALLLLAVAQEAVKRGIDPSISVTSATTAPVGGAGSPTSINDLWGRVVSRIDRTKRGGFRFEGSPIYGRAIYGRDLSGTGVGEDGKVSPVVFGRKDMRGTIWLAVPDKGARFDMAGMPVAGMKLMAMSNSNDSFEKLCDQTEALIAGVETAKVETRRTTETKLAALDGWE